jgi:hypothetical protein
VDLEREVAARDDDASALVESLLDARSEELMAHLGITGDDVSGVAPDRLEAWRDDAVTRLGRLLRGEEPEPSAVAEIVLSLNDVRVRDTVLWDLMDADAEEGWRRAQAVLAHCVRLAPPGAVAPAAAVLAICCWQRGDGARAGVALERALADDPSYSLALLVHQALGAGLPPGAWRGAMAGLRREECRHGVR